MIAAGGVLHLLVVAAPLFVVGGSFRDPATLAFLAGASALYFGDAVTMRWRPTTSCSPLDTRAHRWSAITGVVLLAMFWAGLAERAIVEPTASWLQIAGVLAMVLGAGLRAAAVRTLGRQFRSEIDGGGGALVQHGVYGLARHPSETGLLAASLGCAWLLQSTISVGLWCGALVPVTLMRVSLEEHALARRFGEAHDRYSARVGGLLPRGERFLP